MRCRHDHWHLESIKCAVITNPKWWEMGKNMFGKRLRPQPSSFRLQLNLYGNYINFSGGICSSVGWRRIFRICSTAPFSSKAFCRTLSPLFIHFLIRPSFHVIHGEPAHCSLAWGFRIESEKRSQYPKTGERWRKFRVSLDIILQIWKVLRAFLGIARRHFVWA